MMFAPKILMAASIVSRGVRHWFYHLGGLGFIPLGLRCYVLSSRRTLIAERAGSC